MKSSLLNINFKMYKSYLLLVLNVCSVTKFKISRFKVLKWIIVVSQAQLRIQKISRNCLLLSNRKPETVGGDESGVITRMVSLLYSVRWCGAREGNLSELLRSRHSVPNILGTNPDQFYLNTISRVDQDYCIVMVITRKTQSGNR